ncbi:glutathione peroxidase [Amaricoccus sp.]|uniref:glutathione peroxidase n=1 Tax=Amaricoccus sp. TaxID=1872485 RepID=UPI001B5A8341|nr:glutathione peroxidase [Amaricoccus sp.]MBP7241377.1 glutathione peroxidase [Amaricoccus sp.]
MRRRTIIAIILTALAAALPARGAGPEGAGAFRFAGVDGGEIALADYAGRPVLVVNTASRCGYVDQFDGLQALQDRYRDRGLTIVGVPSDSFRQELATDAAVKEFCEVNFAIDFPIAAIADVTGEDAHPFYRWARGQGAEPTWNFHKILIDGNGSLAGSFPASVTPEAPTLAAAIETTLRQ